MLLYVATEGSQATLQLLTLWTETPFFCETDWLLFIYTNGAGGVNLQECG